MIRRVNGRSPPFIIVGLILLLLILAFNYWTLSTQNSDLQQSVDNLQSAVKISGVKQDQSEKTNAALQDTVHEVKDIVAKQRKKIEEEQKLLDSAQNNIKSKDFEITSLKNSINRITHQLKNVTTFVEDKDYELGILKKENGLVIAQRDDAETAISQMDSTIISLKKELIKAEGEISSLQKDLKFSSSKPAIIPGLMNVPNLEAKQENASQAMQVDLLHQAEMNKFQIPKDLIMPGHLQTNVIARPPKKVSSAGPVIQKPLGPNFMAGFPAIGHRPADVLPLPPHHDNLDTAVDEFEKVIDDPLDDQDEEGKEIKHDLNNNINDYEDNNNNNNEGDNVIRNPNENIPNNVHIVDDFNQPGNKILDNNILDVGAKDQLLQEPQGIGARIGLDIPQAPRPDSAKQRQEILEDDHNHAMENF